MKYEADGAVSYRDSPFYLFSFSIALILGSNFLEINPKILFKGMSIQFYL